MKRKALIVIGALGVFLLVLTAIARLGQDDPVFCPTDIESLDEELARAFLVTKMFEFRGRKDDGFSEPPPDGRVTTREVREYLPSELIRDESVGPTDENLNLLWVFVVRTSFGTRKLSLIGFPNCGYSLNFGHLVR